MEANGKFSLEGCIEMAWIMGLIKHHTGPIKGREGQYSGWIDCKTGQPLSDSEVKSNFEKQIIEHSGIRLVEPSLLGGRDNRLLQEVVVQEDLAPFEASKEQALNFQKQHGDKAEIIPFAGGNEFQVVIKAGAIVMVPRAVPYEHLVAAQVPSGWDARRYGISEDIITQVDKATLYVLVCTAEALLSAGIADPYEFYEYNYVSEVANCIGSGLGGSDALRAISRTGRWTSQPKMTSSRKLSSIPLAHGSICYCYLHQGLLRPPLGLAPRLWNRSTSATIQSSQARLAYASWVASIRFRKK